VSILPPKPWYFDEQDQFRPVVRPSLLKRLLENNAIRKKTNKHEYKQTNMKHEYKQTNKHKYKQTNMNTNICELNKPNKYE